MRFVLNFELKENILPVEYRKVVLSYIKNALTNCNDGKYFDKYFNGAEQKDYCFTVMLPKSTFKKDYVYLKENKFKIVFSCGEKEKTALILYSAFIAEKDKSYPLAKGNFMTLRSLSFINSDEIKNNRVIFKTSLGSGLCVREHDRVTKKDNYYVFNDDLFREKINFVLKNQLLKAGFTEEEVNCVKVNPIDCKKVAVKHYNFFIAVSIGIFEMQGDYRVLQYLYDVGIGSRKSMGFGMVDLVIQDLI